MGAAALHGALTGFHDWWFAVADYRLSVESVATGSVSEKFSLFTDSLRTAGPVVGMLVVLAAPGLWLALRRPESTLLAIWFVLSLTGFALGGLFHGHYYVGPLTPLCALAALTLAAVPPRLGLALGLAALVLPIYKAWPAYTAEGTTERSLASTSDSRIVKDGAVGRYLHAHTRSGDRVYALYADASLYLAAGRRSPYPYLWFLGIEHIPGALQRLRDTLAGPDAPRYIAVYQQPGTIDKRGDIGRILKRRYHARRDDRGRADLALAGAGPRLALLDAVHGAAVRVPREQRHRGQIVLVGNDARVAADFLAALRDRDEIVRRGRDDHEVRPGDVLELLTAGRAGPGICADREPVAVLGVLARVLGDLLVVPDDLFDGEQNGAVIHTRQDTVAYRLPCASPII